jgi:ribosomal protein S18 acetylase RimI-like enzyme
LARVLAPVHELPALPPEALVAVELRPAGRSDRDYVCMAAAEAVARLGHYEGLLGGWFDHAGVTTVLACVEGSRVGFVMWAFVQGPGLAGASPVADVVALVVDPAWRRRGIGRALLRCALRQAGALAPVAFSHRAELSVADDNLAAAALFRSEGFEPRPDADTRYPGGQRCLRLGRPLNAP